MIRSFDTAPALPEGMNQPSIRRITWAEFEAALRTCGEYHWRQDVYRPWVYELHVPMEHSHRARAIVYWLVNAYIRVDVIPLIL